MLVVLGKENRRPRCLATWLGQSIASSCLFTWPRYDDGRLLATLVVGGAVDARLLRTRHLVWPGHPFVMLGRTPTGQGVCRPDVVVVDNGLSRTLHLIWPGISF